MDYTTFKETRTSMVKSKSNTTSIFNKSMNTNILAAVLACLGVLLPEPYKSPVFNVGLFAFSGAITNWLAVHMLFEKIPGLYGSGVIPARFEDFKKGIHDLVMNQFFTRENISRFFEEGPEHHESAYIDFEPVINSLDLDPTFDSFVSVVMESPFGGMLGIIGGETALDSLRKPFSSKIKYSINKIAGSSSFQEAIQTNLSSSEMGEEIIRKVGSIVQKRLDELTPQMVKEIMQDMIKKHLGWLVVWGGVFGGIIGLIASFFSL
jgi:hypothetical protein